MRVRPYLVVCLFVCVVAVIGQPTAPPQFSGQKGEVGLPGSQGIAGDRGATGSKVRRLF